MKFFLNFPNAPFYIFIIIVTMCSVIFVTKLKKTLPLNRITNIFLWLISFIIVTIIPLFVPVIIKSKEQLFVIRFGFPFYFIEQHTNANIKIDHFPLTTTLINSWGHSLKQNLAINPINYFLSIICFYIVLYFFVTLYAYFKKK